LSKQFAGGFGIMESDHLNAQATEEKEDDEERKSVREIDWICDFYNERIE
jgi:hypothetical protein